MVAGRAVVAFALLFAGAAHAQANDRRMPEAAKVYDAAASLYKDGQYGQAAPLFARADELAPNDVALTQALQACILADDAALGMGLAERAARAAPDTPLARAAAKAHRAFQHRVGRIVAHCDCALDVDGVPLDAARRGFVLAGEHAVALHVQKNVEQRTLNVAPGETVDISPQAPPTPPAPPIVLAPPPTPARDAPQPPPTARDAPTTARDAPTPARDAPPTWPFWAGVAVTGALGLAGAISLVDLTSKHDAFASRPDDAAAASGRAAQLRTDVLFLTAGAFALATTVFGFVVFRKRAEALALGVVHVPSW